MSSIPEGEHLHLYTADGLRLDAVHLPPPVGADGAIVMAHGFSGTWRNPRTRHIAAVLNRYAAVLGFDFRGHGRSTGLSTVGDLEVLDIAAAVAAARRRGYRWVAVAGFSMGASVAVRHAALHDGVDAVAAISGPAHWYYRGTTPMRWLHHVVEWPMGRMVGRYALGIRVKPDGWGVPPLTPEECAPKIAPVPLLVMHGDGDRFFPLRHAHALHDAALDPRELWVLRGMGHAESGMTKESTHRLGAWLREAAA